jgi:hypothetical protein
MMTFPAETVIIARTMNVKMGTKSIEVNTAENITIEINSINALAFSYARALS